MKKSNQFCPRNACTRSSNSLKLERLHGQRLATRRQGKGETIAWLLWHNQTRPYSTLACVSPVRFEQDGLAARSRQASS